MIIYLSILVEIYQLFLFSKGGAHPNTSNDDSDDYGDIPFQQSGITQQEYARYQMPQLNGQFIDTYGFNDDDFNDGDDGLQ